MNENPALIARNLSIGYIEKWGKESLSEGLNFELNCGELVCLIGPNGAGKSTLIRTLAGLQPALDGNIELMGKSLTTYKPHQIAQYVSLVLTKSVQVMNMTAFDVVALGRHPFTNWLGQLSRNDHEIIMKALSDVGAEKFSDREINHLSDGERQKIMIARALAQQPKVLILDEPTAFLDFPNRVEILAMLRRLANDNQQAVMLSTHDLNLAIGVADKMMIMDEQGSLYIGAPEDLILNGNFEKAFNPDQALNFNTLEGTFSFHFENGQSFSIEASNELLYTWTKKAVERQGYQVDNESGNQIVVSVENDRPQWKIVFKNQLQQFASIYEFVQFLRVFSGHTS